jgi:hypothetical protein
MINILERSKGLAKNPLGIIALFISLIYGFACLVLSTSISNLISSERLPLIWFIIGFPIIILLAFIYLVTKHHQKLYSPSDYGSAESFLKTIEGSKKFQALKIDMVKDDKIENTLNNTVGLIRKFENTTLNKGLFSDITKENLGMANEFFREFQIIIKDKAYRDKFSVLAFEVQAPEYYILTYTFQKQYLKSEDTTSTEHIILRVTRDNNGILNMIGIGKDIIETDPKSFAIKIADHLEGFAIRSLKE